jgi:hypothetical protein
MLIINGSSLRKIIHKNSQFKKVWLKWVPSKLANEHVTNRVELCVRLLKLYQKEGELFLKRRITQDKSWIYDFEPELIWRRMNLKHPSSPNIEVQGSAIGGESHAYTVLSLGRAYTMSRKR